MAIKTVMRLMDDKSDSAESCIPLKCSYTNYNSTVKAVIGESHSEISVVIARLLSIPLIPQISYESTSEILSQKLRFPSFLRTVPSDTHQSKAIAKLALHLNLISVGAIGSDDEYGKYGVEGFLDHAQELGLCVPFKHIVPAYMFRNESSNHQKKIVEIIMNSSAEAIVLFTKPENVEGIIQEAIKHNLTKTWIASDSWVTSAKIAQIKGIETVGKIIGFTYRRKTVPRFKNYIRNLFANDPPDNSFLRQYKDCYPPCSKKPEPNIQNSLSNTNNETVNVSECTDDNFLIQMIDTDIFFGVYLAVNAVAQALGKLLICDSTKCERDFNFPSWEVSNSPLLFLLIILFKLEICLLKELKKVNFSVDNTEVSFDENGDFKLGYDIIGWQIDGAVNFTTIGEYHISGQIILYNKMAWTSENILITDANCSKKCNPGYEWKETNLKCCKACIPCKIGSVSAGGSK
ncbi:G-protein coupled receptor family C group 6 member A-like [Polyodon spathula]|uniref:G-protein coupled receptor family C group 6 member A-like n=1 Tax=Polyodon spathula TaxID=7913 RepID=UPI001B7E823C|nr:G-protein coupled receptor family C group 6 member A-like [Polyodon spathula]